MKKLMILVLALISSSTWASGEDLENCRWKDGREMDWRDCATFRRIAAEDKEKDDAHQKMVAEMHEQQRRNEDARQSEKAKQQAIIEEANQKRIAEMARQEAENRHNREQMAREEEKEEAAKKRKCGKDYMVLRVGMTLDRISQCYEETSYVTDTVGKGGVVKTYRGNFYFIYVQNGRVIGYTRRTN